MLYFVNDYSEGAHEAILKKIAETNYESLDAYGADKYSLSAKDKIRRAAECPDAEIFFLSGGTQSNAVVIDSLLRSYEGVVSAATGHVSGHEAGAIEYTGHKVIELPQTDGKLCADVLADHMARFYKDENREHMVKPGMVYISQPTEFGTLYSKAELQQLSEVCRRYSMPLYADGARLGYALACPACDVTLKDMAELCDVFYIGGTKVGALCGEAVVFTKKNMPDHFMTIVKQHGALLAKGRVLGVQFDTLFTDDLYMKISKNAIDTAEMLKCAFRDNGYEFYVESPTNQIFIVLENSKMKELQKEAAFSFWDTLDDTHTIVRLATSWATREEDVRKLINIIEK